MAKNRETDPTIDDSENDLSNEFVPDSEVEDGLGRIVIEGPLYPNIGCVNTNFTLNMMMCDYYPKYKDVLMNDVPGFLATVKKSEVGEVGSVTYMYVGDLVESITGGLIDTPRSEDLDEDLTVWLKDEDDVDDDADGDYEETEDDGISESSENSTVFSGH